MTEPRFLPWQLDTARHWLQNRERFAHAWLIHGLTGIGKLDFALAAAASLLCESPQHGMACGQCAACAWIVSGSHPDLRRIRPDAVALEEGTAAAEPAEDLDAAGGTAKRAPSKEIRIDQIRGLESWFNTATHRGGWRVAVLYPAQALNTISANALLKVLEEPPEHTVFLIVADAPDRLLPTLVSRCRRLPLPAPSADQSLQWLQEQGVASAGEWLAAAGGAPLAALRLGKERDRACPAWLFPLLEPLAQGVAPDIGALTDTLEKVAASEWIDALQRMVVDLMLSQAGADTRYFPALRQLLGQIATRADAARIADFAHWLTRERALASHPLNPKLLLHATLQRVAQSCLAA